jgi:hypothetical protein
MREINSRIGARNGFGEDPESGLIFFVATLAPWMVCRSPTSGSVMDRMKGMETNEERTIQERILLRH